jgi:hypothetical protein
MIDMTVTSKESKEHVRDFGYLTDKEKKLLNQLSLRYQTAEFYYNAYKENAEKQELKLNVIKNTIYDKIWKLDKLATLRKEQQCEHENAHWWQCYRDDCSHPRGIHSECKDCGSGSLIKVSKEIYGKSAITTNEHEDMLQRSRDAK